MMRVQVPLSVLIGRLGVLTGMMQFYVIGKESMKVGNRSSINGMVLIYRCACIMTAVRETVDARGRH
jgi:hypothetical protein